MRDGTAPDVTRSSSVIPGATHGSFQLPPDVAFVVERGEGAALWSTDGRRFVDFFLASGPLVLGHAHPRVVEAVRRQAGAGMLFGYLNEPATMLAERIVELIPCAEAVKFCSSGTEATFYALRIARAATQRELILKFSGGFHGSHDYGLHVLNADGRPKAESGGIPSAVGASVLLAPFNDKEAVRKLVEAHATDLAAIIVEPVQRAIEPEPGFLEYLRQLADQSGALLVFDEIVTAFRMSMSGAQGVYGVKPDLCTLGKALGGGLPLAAVAGRRDLIELTVPMENGDRPVYMGNTYNGNPLSTAAGFAALEVMSEEEGPSRIAANGAIFAEGLREVGRRLSVPLQVIGPPGFCEPVIGTHRIRDDASYQATNRRAATAFGVELIRRGVMVYPGRKFYTSAVHTGEHIEFAIEMAHGALQAVREKGLIPD